METSYNDDPLSLQPSDHLGLQLINLKLTGPNFQWWSKYVRIALRTKGKLGFLDGSCTKPVVNCNISNPHRARGISTKNFQTKRTEFPLKLDHTQA